MPRYGYLLGALNEPESIYPTDTYPSGASERQSAFQKFPDFPHDLLVCRIILYLLCRFSRVVNIPEAGCSARFLSRCSLFSGCETTGMLFSIHPITMPYTMNDNDHSSCHEISIMLGEASLISVPIIPGHTCSHCQGYGFSDQCDVCQQVMACVAASNRRTCYLCCPQKSGS